MYEDLEKWDPKGGLLKALRPKAEKDVAVIEQEWPGIPDQYLQFRRERGVGGGSRTDFILFFAIVH